MQITKPTSATAYPGAWGVLALLFVINLLNFIDRMIPAVMQEDIRKAYDLSDLWMGILVSSFTVTFALCGLPLGRLADTWIRKNVLGSGVLIWSAFTCMSGLAPNFGMFFLARLGVGVGEASFGPAAVSLIGDMFPQRARGRAMGLFMLGLPVGISLSFILISKLKVLTHSWQLPFVLAGAVGLVAGAAGFLIREPSRGADAANGPIRNASRRSAFWQVFAIRTMWWVCLSGVTVNMASYATNTFFNAFLQRYYGANAMDAGWIAAGVLGLTGLLAMTLGAYLTDLAQQHTLGGRLKLGAYSMLAAGPLVAAALCLSPQNNISAFVLLYGGGWTLFFMYYVSVYTVVQDVVVPHLRATAMAVYFAAQYLIGSSLGTTVVGGLSDYFAKREMVIAGASSMTDVFKGQGLHWAMFLVPLMLIISSGVLFMALRTYRKDHIDPT